MTKVLIAILTTLCVGCGDGSKEGRRAYEG
jgi:hypothetical protein